MKYLLLFFFFSFSISAQLVQSVKPWLGVAIGDGKKGVFVKMALPGTPAQKAGIKRGDEILSINGKKVTKPGALIKEVTSIGVGNTATVLLLRNEKELRKEMVLVAKPELEKIAKKKLMNQKAPDFDLEVIQGLDKKRVSLKDFAGKTTILEFWSVSCPACISAHPRLVQFAKKNKEKINLVSITADKKLVLKKYLGKIDSILKEKERNIIFLRSEDGKVIGDYMSNAIPMFVILNKEGVVVDIGIGAGKVLEEILSKAKSI